jgi:transposase
MLLRHYLEHGTSKSTPARQFGVSRDTIHRWIRAGDLDRDLDDEAVRHGPRPPVDEARRLQPIASRCDSRPIPSCRRCAFCLITPPMSSSCSRRPFVVIE